VPRRVSLGNAKLSSLRESASGTLRGRSCGRTLPGARDAEQHILRRDSLAYGMRRKPLAEPAPATADDERARLDQWLWAARFFKTRSLAAEAIEGGKVQVNDERAKRAKPVRAGDVIRVRLGPYEHLVTVRAVAARRGPAAAAAELYEERPESREARERLAAQLKSVAPLFHYDKGRPTKKDRRDIERLRGREPGE